MKKLLEYVEIIQKNYTKLDISNDPNFIFENDPSYDGVKLWDSDGNTAFVNSFRVRTLCIGGLGAVTNKFINQ